MKKNYITSYCWCRYFDNEQWPTEFTTIPELGDTIESRSGIIGKVNSITYIINEPMFEMKIEVTI